VGLIVQVSDIKLDFNMLSLRGDIPAIEAVQLKTPRIQLKFNENGSLFPVDPDADIVAEADSSRGIQLPPLLIQNLELSDGDFYFENPSPDAPTFQLSGIKIAGSADLKKLISEGEFNIDKADIRSPVAIETDRPTVVNWSIRKNGQGIIELTTRMDGSELKGQINLANIPDAIEYDVKTILSGFPELIRAQMGVSDLIKGDAELTASAKGKLSGPVQVDLKVDGRKLRINEIPVSSVDANCRLETLSTVIAELDAGISDGHIRLTIQGGLDPASQPLNMQLTASGIQVSHLVPPQESTRSVTGLIRGNADLSLEGWTPDRMAGAISLATEKPLKVDGMEGLDPEIMIKGTLQDGIVSFEKFDLQAGNTNGTITGFYDINQKVFDSGIRLNSSDLSGLLSLAGLYGGGMADIDLKTSGSISRPEIQGHVRIKNLEVEQWECRVPDLTAKVEDGHFELQTDQFEYGDYHGRLSARGQFSDITALTGSLEAELSNFRYRESSPMDIRASLVKKEQTEILFQTTDEQLSGDFVVLPGSGMKGQVQTKRLDLSIVQPFVPDDYQDLEGHLTGHAQFQIPENAGPIDVFCNIKALNIQLKDLNITNEEPIICTYKDSHLKFDSLRLKDAGGLSLALSGSMNLDTSGMDLIVVSDIPDLSILDPIIGSCSGSSIIDVKITGQLDQPKPVGRFSVENFVFQAAQFNRLHADLIQGSEKESVQANLILAGFSWESISYPDSSAEISMLDKKIFMDLDLLHGQINGSCSIDLGSANRIISDLDLRDLNLYPLLAMIQPDREMRGSITGNCVVQGSLNDINSLDAALELTETSLEMDTFKLSNQGTVSVLKQGEMIRVSKMALQGSGIQLDVSGSLPMNQDQSDETTSFDATNGLRCSGNVELNSFLPFLDNLDRLAGQIGLDVSIGNNLIAPEFNGRIELTRAAMDGPDFPAMDNMSGIILLNNQSIQLEQMIAGMGNGNLTMSGSVPMGEFFPKGLSIAAQGHNLEMQLNAAFDMITDLELQVTENDKTIFVNGSAEIIDSLYSQEINFLELLQSVTETELDLEQSFDFGQEESLPVRLDINLVIPDSFRILGTFMDIQIGGNLRLEGPTSAPSVKGILNLTEGMINLVGSRFEIAKGTVHFNDPLKIDPELDVVAVTEKHGDEITLQIKGRSSNVNLRLSSTIGLSQSEILNRIAGVGGGDSGQGGWDEVVLEAAMQELASQFMNMLGERSGLIVVPFPVTEESEDMIFGIGKTMGDQVTLMYYKSADKGMGDAVEVKIDISPETKLMMRQNSDDSISGGLRYQIPFN